MIIYSEKLDKQFDTVRDCEKAEKAYDIEQEKIKKEKETLKQERATRAKEVEEAFKEIKIAQDKYNELLEQFINDYGSYHFTYNSVKDFPDILGIFEQFLK